MVAVGFRVVNVDRGNIKSLRPRCGLGWGTHAWDGSCEKRSDNER
jgi:hypothetical protein